jgi:hypothetical protein
VREKSLDDVGNSTGLVDSSKDSGSENIKSAFVSSKKRTGDTLQCPACESNVETLDIEEFQEVEKDPNEIADTSVFVRLAFDKES